MKISKLIELLKEFSEDVEVMVELNGVTAPVIDVDIHTIDHGPVYVAVISADEL